MDQRVYGTMFQCLLLRTPALALVSGDGYRRNVKDHLCPARAVTTSFGSDRNKPTSPHASTLSSILNVIDLLVVHISQR